MSRVEFPYEAEARECRTLFPHCREGIVYLDHAATSPLPTPVLEAVQRYLEWRHRGQMRYDWELERMARARALAAELIGAPSPETIAFMPNTTTGLAVIALSLPWSAGESVVVGAQEFPAAVYPWRALQRFGVHLRFVPMPGGALPVERIAEALDESVRVVVVSAVQFLSGYRVDLEALGKLCQERGILLVVDGMQAVGAVRVDVQRGFVAALACGGAKWLMAPHGAGFLYVAPQLLEQLTPALLGWLAAEDPWDFFAFQQPLAPTARRFEGGSPDYGAIVGLCAALELFAVYGPDRIQERLLALSAFLRERLCREFPELLLLTPEEARQRAGIVTVRVGSSQMAAEIVARLAQRRVYCSARLEYVRFSPHWYATAAELEYAVAAFREVLQEVAQRSSLP